MLAVVEQSVLVVVAASFVVVVPGASCSAVAVDDLVAVIVVANRPGDVVGDLAGVIVGAPRFGAGVPDRVDGIAVAGRCAVAARGPDGAMSRICLHLNFDINWDFLSHWGGLVRKPIPCMGPVRSTGYRRRD